MPLIEWAVGVKEEKYVKKESWENTRKQTLEILFLHFCSLYINKVGENTLTPECLKDFFWLTSTNMLWLQRYEIVESISEESVKMERSTFTFYFYKILNFCQTNLIMGRLISFSQTNLIMRKQIKYKLIWFNALRWGYLSEKALGGRRYSRGSPEWPVATRSSINAPGVGVEAGH